jgi:hypothetical protein
VLVQITNLNQRISAPSGQARTSKTFERHRGFPAQRKYSKTIGALKTKSPASLQGFNFLFS